jgi:hypothetical protein
VEDCHWGGDGPGSWGDGGSLNQGGNKVPASKWCPFNVRRPIIFRPPLASRTTRCFECSNQLVVTWRWVTYLLDLSALRPHALLTPPAPPPPPPPPFPSLTSSSEPVATLVRAGIRCSETSKRWTSISLGKAFLMTSPLVPAAGTSIANTPLSVYLAALLACHSRPPFLLPYCTPSLMLP